MTAIRKRAPFAGYPDDDACAKVPELVADLVAGLREAMDALALAEKEFEQQRPFEDLEACCSVPRETEFDDELLYNTRRKARATIAKLDQLLSGGRA